MIVNSEPLFSIIVPVYKTEKYLPKCIDSILNQTYNDFELILVDDGSPDNCPQICDKYARSDSRIKVIHKKNGGVSSARNLGISVARGTYIWFVDSDDYIEPFSLQRLFEVQNSYNAELYVFNNRSVCELSTENINDFFRKYYFTYVLGFEPWNKLYKRDVIKANNLQFDTQETIGEDLLFNLNYYKTIFSDGAKDIYFIGEDYYHYVERNDSAMHSDYKYRVVQIMRLFDKMEKILKDTLSKETLEYMFILHFISGISQSFIGDLSSKEFSNIIDFSKYKHYFEDMNKSTIKQYFSNVSASLFLKCRVKIFLLFMKKGMYKMAGKTMKLK